MRTRPLITLFAAALAAGLSAASALAQYYPAPDSPVDVNAALDKIQKALQLVHTTETLVIPPPTGFTAAIDADFSVAVATAVHNAEAGGLPTPADIVGAAAAYRPSKASKFMVNVTQTLIADHQTALLTGPTGAVAKAVDGSGKNAAAITASVITQLALSTVPGDTALEDDVTGAAVTEFETDTQIIDNVAKPPLVGKIVAAAIGASKKSPGQEAAIAFAAVTAAKANGGSSQLEEITLAAISSTAKLKPADVTAQVTAVTNSILAAAAAGTDEPTAVQIVAAAALGTTAVPASFATNLGAVKAAVDGSASYSTVVASLDTAIDFVQTKFSSFVKSDKTSAGTLAAAYITAHPAHADATVAAATEMQPKSGADIITKALAAPHDVSATPVSIITAVVRAYPANAANVAKAIINDSHSTADAITNAVISGSPADLDGAIASAAVKGLGTPGNFILVAQGATLGAFNSGHTNAFSSIALNIAKASKQAATTATNMLGAASLTGLEDAQIAAGAVAADKKDADATISSIDSALSGNLTNQGLAHLAGTLVKSILVPLPNAPKDPLAYYNLTNQALALPANSGNANAEAILTAATTANPKATSALVATTLVSTNGDDEANLVKAATGQAYKLGPNIQAAADAVVHVLGTTNDLFDYVRDAAIKNPALALDVATGADIASPQRAHIVGHAFAFADPAAAAKIIPVLFSYSNITAPKDHGDGIPDTPARAAAISAGVFDGVIEAGGGLSQADPKIIKKTTAILKASVSTAVKASLLLQSSVNIPTSKGDGTGGADPGTGSDQPEQGAAAVITGYVSQAYLPITGTKDIDANMQAILNAAGKAGGKLYAIQMAQAAAQAAASEYLIFNPTLNPATTFTLGTDFAGIVAAFTGVSASASPNAIQSAVNFGIDEAIAGRFGAGAAGVVNYTVRPNSPVTGPFVTSIYEL